MSDGKKLITAILENGSIETLRLVTEDLFEAPELELFQFVKSHFRRYGILPDIGTVETETRQRLPNAAEPISFYLKKIYDRKLFVALREEFGSLRDSLQEFDVDVAKAVIDRMKAACRISTPDNDVRSIGEATDEVMRLYEEAHQEPERQGVPTGWHQFDAVTGGYQNGDLIAWIARMGIGKTYLLLKQAIYAWEMGYNVLFVTMEMTIEQIVRRIIGMGANINPMYLRHGSLDRYAMRRLQGYLSRMAYLDRFHIFAGSFSKKVSDLDVLMHELTPDIIFIDGAYLMIPDGTAKNANRLEKVADVYGQLKKMTITHNRPVVTTSQFSRQAGKRGKDGSLETISFSDAIAMHSSIVVSVKEGKPPLERTRRLIDILKGREGEHLSMHVNYGFTPTDFSEVPAEAVREEQGDPDWMV